MVISSCRSLSAEALAKADVFVAENMFNQIDLIMQNKANFMKNPPFVSYEKSNGYENAPPFLAQKSQSQFPKCQNEHNLLLYNELWTTNYELRTKKQTQFKPNQSQFCPS